MNIEWKIIGKPALISKLQDRCYGITVYLCRALLELWEFIKFTVQTLNAQLSERFTDHQRVTRLQ